MLEEAETLLCENNGVVVFGVFPTGGQHGTNPMGRCVSKLLGLEAASLIC